MSDALPKSLSSDQRRIIDELVGELSNVDHVAAIVLGGSFARGTETHASDIDLGLMYSENTPFAPEGAT